MDSGVDEYLEARAHRLLTEHPALAEQGITLRWAAGGLVVSGEVESGHRREEICRVLAEHFPQVPLRCDVGVVRAPEPVEVEDLP